MKTDRSITLRLYADPAWIPMVQGMAEQSGIVFGLDQGKALRLTMAVEEILAYLSELTPGAPLDLTLAPGASHVDTIFSFSASDADLWAMNITACGLSCAEENLQAMGLLLAARMSDGLEVRRDGASVTLRLRMDRTYPAQEREPSALFAARGALSFQPALDPAQIKRACALAKSTYPADLLPLAFGTPGKIVDQILGGELYGALALDESGNVCGFMTWEQRSATSVAFCGPYVFALEADTIARGLTDHLISAVARTAVSAILSQLPTKDLPQENFELLGTLPLTAPDGTQSPLPVWFRSMREDNGLAVWTHPDLEDFLRAAYDRLFLMRDVHSTTRQGEQIAGRSVFATTIRPEIVQALITPMLDGVDTEVTIQKHVELLQSEGYRNILVHLDLAQGWQAAMIPALLANDFEPRLVLPHASQADMVVLQHAGS
jgi:hypothetical protein